MPAPRRHIALTKALSRELGPPTTPQGSRARASWTKTASALRFAHRLFDERVEAAQSPAPAEVADRGHIGIRVARQEFHDVGKGLRSPRIQFESDEVRERHVPRNGPLFARKGNWLCPK